MIFVGPVALLLRWRNHDFIANLTLAAGMIAALLAAHEGYVRFNPILGSKDLALSITRAQQASPHPDDLIILDGELTSGSTLVFYTRQQVHLINGRVNGLWYGSFWPDAPAIFETNATLHSLWSGPRRIFLFTYNPTDRQRDLAPFGSVHTLTSAVARPSSPTARANLHVENQPPSPAKKLDKTASGHRDHIIPPAKAALSRHPYTPTKSGWCLKSALVA